MQMTARLGVTQRCSVTLVAGVIDNHSEFRSLTDLLRRLCVPSKWPAIG